MTCVFCAQVAVRNNSFAVRRGEVFGLLGPNGAGKTTTLNMIIAEEGPTTGKVSGAPTTSPTSTHPIQFTLCDLTCSRL